MNPDFIQTLQAQARSAERLDAAALRRAIQDAEYALTTRLDDTPRRTVQMALKALRYEQAQRQRDSLGAGPDEAWSESWDTSGGSAKDAAAGAAKASQGAAKQANKPASRGGAKASPSPSPASEPPAPTTDPTSDTSDTTALLLGGGIAVVAVVAGAELIRQKKRERARQAGGGTP